MILLGNAACLVGCVLMVYAGFIHKKSRILTCQVFQFGFFALGNLFLGGTSGVISNAVSIVRNLVFAKVENTFVLKLIFILIQVFLTVGSGMNSFVDWMPILTAVIYTWFLDLKNPVSFKWMIIFCQLLWLVYDSSHNNYVTVAFGIMTIISNGIGIWNLKKKAYEKAPLKRAVLFCDTGL